jgi:AcrR family transcriptional regulator
VGRPASDVREQIVSAALGILHERGVRALVQTRVARAAGVPQGHLTYYFPKKADLLVAVARRFREDTAREAARWFGPGRPQGLSREERVLAVVRGLGEDLARTRALVGLMLESESEPALHKEMLEGAADLRRFLAWVLGREEPDADVDLVLALFWGLGIQHLLAGGAQGKKQHADLAARAAALIPLLARPQDAR